MVETTNIDTATEYLERAEQGPGRGLGWYQRLLLIPLIALAFFGVASVAAPEEALAAGTGWYPTNHGGQTWNCWWIYYGNDVWSEDGCSYYYNGAGPAYYYQWSSGDTWIWSGGRWVGIPRYWYNSTVTEVISAPQNESGLYYLMTQFPRFSGTAVFSSSRSATEDVTSETSRRPEAPPRTESSGTAQASQVVQARSTDYPWKVCQDDGGCFRYSGSAWKKVKTSKAQGGSYRVSSSKSRGAFFAATGSTDAGGGTMKLVTATGPKMGRAKVIVVNLASAKVVKKATFDLKTSKSHHKVVKSITGLTPHRPYGLIVLSADGRPVAVDAVGYEAHGSKCHSTL